MILGLQFTPSDSANVVPFPSDPEQTYSGELFTERLINYYVKHHPVDKNRIYMIGQGAYGGSGALDLAVRNPDMFAAVVSIGGAVCPDRVKSIKNCQSVFILLLRAKGAADIDTRCLYQSENVQGRQWSLLSISQI